MSEPLPGAVHDLTAARIWGIITELVACALVVLADKGHHGADGPDDPGVVFFPGSGFLEVFGHAAGPAGP